MYFRVSLGAVQLYYIKKHSGAFVMSGKRNVLRVYLLGLTCL